MKLFRIVAIAALAMVSSVSAQAGFVLSNMGSNGLDAAYSSSSNITGTKIGGSGFTVGASDFFLNSINVATVGNGVITATIVDAVGNNPGTNVFTSATKSVIGGDQIVTFNFNDFQLQAGESYFVTLNSTLTNPAWYVKTSSPSVIPPGGLTFLASRYSEDNGVSWDSSLGVFQIAYNGSTVPPAVPEPALTSLLCLSGIALIRRRMKK
jgi:hypothetical protein